MPENWAPGDAALCIKSRSWWQCVETIFGPVELSAPGPESGELNTVVAVVPNMDIPHGCKSTEALVFARYGDTEYCACAFVKVTPGAEIAGREVEKRRPVPTTLTEALLDKIVDFLRETKWTATRG